MKKHFKKKIGIIRICCIGYKTAQVIIKTFFKRITQALTKI